MVAPYAAKWPSLSPCSRSISTGRGVSESQMIAATSVQPTASASARIGRILEERELPGVRRRCLEQRALELGATAAGAMLVETVLAAGDVEALGDQVGEIADAGHARAETRIVVAAAAHLMDDADHVLG